jgi:FG-GAP repeat/Astacin (Peptidase family M12A)
MKYRSKVMLMAVSALALMASLLLTSRTPRVQAEPDRWPENIVTYYIDESVNDDHEQGIKAAIAVWEERTALKFRKITAVELADADRHNLPRPAYLHYIDRGNKYHSYDYAAIEEEGDLDAFPFLREGDWVIKFAECPSLPCGDKEPWGDNAHIPIHETGHVLGLPHEAKRSDRTDEVRFFPCCADESEESFAKEELHIQALKPYDIKSVMQYSSTTHCKKPEGASICTCLPLLFKNGKDYVRDPAIASSDQEVKDGDACVTDSSVNGRVIEENPSVSYEDVNAIYQMYPPKLGNNESGDEFGQAMAAGDFDGDGYSDLAVGAPGESPVDDPKSGAVFLFKGTYTGLVSWRTLTQTGLGVNQSGDRFGGTVAAGDFNDDGRDELIVGAPGEKISGASGGAVFVFLGTDHGPSTENGYLLHQDNMGFPVTSHDDDLFGASLAVGNFNGDSRLDLAIGAPGKNPGGRVFILTWDKSRASGDKFVKFDHEGNQREAGDLFGTALTSADVNGDGFDDLVVGAPGITNGTGSIFVFPGGKSKFSEPAQIKQPLGSAREAGDFFGTALATGHFSNGTRPQIVVGAPGKQGTGRIYVIRLLYNGKHFDKIDRWNSYNQGSLAASEPNDRFGEVLAVADFDGDKKDDLAVGIPSKDVFVLGFRLYDQGAVALFRGNTSDEFLTHWAFYAQPLSYPTNRSEDRFGAALGAANFNRITPGIPDLAMGVPGKGNGNAEGAGAMFVARGRANAGEAPTLSQEANPTRAQLPPNTSFWTYFDQELAERR